MMSFENLYKGQISKSGVAIFLQKEQEESQKLKNLV